MQRIVFASMHRDSGKTSLLLGYALEKGGAGYMKPLGDRPHYKKKRLWDSDASLMARVLELDTDPEMITLGFDHSKIRFSHPGEALEQRLLEAAEAAEAGKELLLVEAGADLAFGASLGLDPVSLARLLQARLYVVLAGDPEVMADDAHFLARRSFSREGLFGGVILNRVSEPEEFTRHHLPLIEAAGLPVAGIVPREGSVCALTLAYLEDELFVKPIAGRAGAETVVDGVFSGVVSAGAARKSPAFHSRNKLVVTEVDRTDLIVAALETGAAGIVLSGEGPPDGSVIALAREKDVPMLLTSVGMIEISRQIEALQPLPSYRDTGRQEQLKRLARDHLLL